MRALTAFVLLILGAFACAQDLKETHGKTNAQILAMGYDKWYAFYTGFEGESTLGMSNANIFYADALAWRNKKLMTKLPAAKQKALKALHPLMHTFGLDAVQLGRALAGGGTIYTLFGSGQVQSLEQTFYDLMNPKAKPAPAMVVSTARKELEEMGKAINESEGFEGFPKASTLKIYAEAKASFEKIVTILKGMDRKSSDRVLAFCRDAMKDMMDQN